MATNSYTDRRESQKKHNKVSGFDIGEVVSVAPNARHTIMYRLRGVGGTLETAPVLVQARSDIGLPSEGDLVIVGYSRSGAPFVVGTLYSEQDATLDYQSEERRIGHVLTNSSLSIKNDGRIEFLSVSGTTMNLNADGSVSVATESGSSLTMEENGDIEVTNSAGSSIRLEGDTVVVDCNNVELAGTGGDAVARVGDSVSVDTQTGSGTITSGSSSVNAN